MVFKPLFINTSFFRAFLRMNIRAMRMHIEIDHTARKAARRIRSVAMWLNGRNISSGNNGWAHGEPIYIDDLDLYPAVAWRQHRHGSWRSRRKYNNARSAEFIAAHRCPAKKCIFNRNRTGRRVVHERVRVHDLCFYLSRRKKEPGQHSQGNGFEDFCFHGCGFAVNKRSCFKGRRFYGWMSTPCGCTSKVIMPLGKQPEGSGPLPCG